MRSVPTITDPETGKVYAIPAGAAEDGDGTDGTPPETGEGDDGDGDDQGEGTGEDTGDDDENADKGRKGGEDQLRADLARERKRRQEAEQALTERERENESDAERIRREAREEALTPGRTLARRQAVTEAARDIGFVDVTDAYAALVADGELDSIEVDDDALTVVDPDAIATTLGKLAKRKPHLLTPEARAKLEGRSSSGNSGSSVDGQGAGSGKPNNDGAWLLARR